MKILICKKKNLNEIVICKKKLTVIKVSKILIKFF